MKGAWVMHTLRSAIDNDEIWFQILYEFMTENAKGFANTNDFLKKYMIEQVRIIGILLNNIFIHRNNLYLNIIKLKIDFILDGTM